MKFLLFLCLFALTAYVSAASISSLADNIRRVHLPRLTDKHIVGGNSTTIEKYPYQVSVRNPNGFLPGSPFDHWCGGSIYSDRIIITAAHCIFESVPSELQVFAGSTHRAGSDGYIVSVEKIVANENFDPITMDNDIAILVLSAPLPLNNHTIKAIELSQHGPYEGEMAIVSGWGLLTEAGEIADELQEVNVPIMSNEVCNEDYENEGRITEAMFCAGYRGIGEKDACQGDSGGPVLVNGELAGVVSWGWGCAQAEYPGVYTKVSYFHPWLMEKINNLELS